MVECHLVEEGSFIDWRCNKAAERSFLSSDVESLLVAVSNTSSGGYFRFLDGFGLTSPRCRYGGRSCLVLHRFKAGWYLVRTSLPSCRRTLSERRHTYRLFILKCLTDHQTPGTSFDWILAGHFDENNNVNTKSEGELSTTPPPVGHFEIYAANSRRYVIVVGPPHKMAPSAEHPTTCVVDANRQTIQIVELKLPDSGTVVWPANAAFDPRSSRDHIAAIVCCSDRVACLPRDDQTGSLALYDVKTDLISSTSGTSSYLSVRLQYVGHGNQLIALSPGMKTSDVISDEAAFVLLSSDDLSVLRRLPLTSSTRATWRSDLGLLYSVDYRQVALVWRDTNRKSLYDHQSCISARDCSERVEISPLCMAQTTLPVSSWYSVTERKNQCYCQQLQVAVYRIQVSTAPSLTQLCASVIHRLTQSIESLPVPKEVKTNLSDCRRLYWLPNISR